MQNPFFRRYNRYPLHVAVKNVYKDLEKINIKMSAQTLDHIADKAELIPHGDKKHAITFLLGFYVVEANDISKEKLRYVVSQLNKLDPNISEEDIIRYARLLY